MSRTRRVRVPLAALATVTALSALLAGCGIRSTSVPVDAGAAPSRVGCVLPGEGGEDAAKEPAVRVYLVCGSRVAPVDRQVRMPEGRSSAERLPVARKLLEELQRRPGSPEEDAGFETDLPDDLRITDGREGDPDEALRLSEPLDQLPSFALAQIVCTFADTAAADADNAVTLGGPAGDKGGDEDDEQAEGPLKRFKCDAELRARPQAAETAGTKV